MTINEHATEFAGKTVEVWGPGTPLGDLDQTMYRLTLGYDAPEGIKRWADLFTQYLADPAAGMSTGIVVGAWGEMLGEEEGTRAVVEALVAVSDRLPKLRAIFLGDVIVEESEISWIGQTDVSPLLAAYPRLEHFRVRGGNGLRLGRLRHDHLRTLIVESGGLPVSVVREVTAAQLPALEHLELWLGDDGYGADATVADLESILAGTLFPRLRYLGLRDSYMADEVAAAVARSPVLEKIRVLDLSLGTLGDEGARALVASPALRRLERLDIHHHYCTPPMVEELENLGIEVDASDPQEPDETDRASYRYVAVGE